MQSRSKRILIIFACALTVLIIGLIALSANRKQKLGADKQVVDKFSHQTISDPSGKTPDQFGALPDEPVYLGFDSLLNYGLSYTQLNNLKVAFYKFSLSQKTPVKYISVDVDHIGVSYDKDSSDPLHHVSFKVQVNQNDIYQAKLQYVGLTDIRLFISDANNKTVYDSLVIGDESN